jgi:hypothetical protein
MQVLAGELVYGEDMLVLERGLTEEGLQGWGDYWLRIQRWPKLFREGRCSLRGLSLSRGAIEEP